MTANTCERRQHADARFVYLIRRSIRSGRFVRAMRLDTQRRYAIPVWGQPPLPSLLTDADWDGVRAELGVTR